MSISNTCRASTACRLTPSSPSTAPPASSISRSRRARDGATAAAFLERFLALFPLPVHTILSDNGGEWTDRFAVDKKAKPAGRPSGNHPVDRFCRHHNIVHRLTRPFRPQTNGMVERFNRRLAEHLERIPHNSAGHHKRFASRAARDRYVLTFVHDYNRTRLHCLGYRAPAEALANLAGLNTFAGERRYQQCRLKSSTPPLSAVPRRDRRAI
jgi:transposase InsO family protein